MKIKNSKFLKTGISAVLLLAFTASGMFGSSLAVKALESSSSSEVSSVEVTQETYDNSDVNNQNEATKEQSEVSLPDSVSVDQQSGSEEVSKTETSGENSDDTSILDSSIVEGPVPQAISEEDKVVVEPDKNKQKDKIELAKAKMDEEIEASADTTFVINPSANSSIFNIADAPKGTTLVVVNTGVQTKLNDSRKGAERVPVNVVVNPGSGVAIPVGVAVNDITTGEISDPVVPVKPIIISGTAQNIIIREGTHLESSVYDDIVVGPLYYGASVEKNIIVEDNVYLGIGNYTRVGIGAGNGATIKGDIIVGDNFKARYTGGFLSPETVIGTMTWNPNYKTTAGNIVVGDNVDIDVSTTTAAAIIGFSSSDGGNITVGNNATVKMRRQQNYSAQGVAIGVNGSNSMPATAGDIFLGSYDYEHEESNIEFVQGLAVGAYDNATAKSITIGDNNKFMTYRHDPQYGEDFYAEISMYVGAIFSSKISGNVNLGDNLSFHHEDEKNLALGIGAAGSTIGGTITIGDNFKTQNSLVGVGSISLGGPASVQNIVIGENASIQANIVAVGSYGTSRPATAKDISIGTNSYLKSYAVGAGAFSKSAKTGSINLALVSEIYSSRLGVGAANGGTVEGNIFIGHNSIMSSYPNSPHYTAVGAGLYELGFSYTGQKVKGNIEFEGNLTVRYTNSNTDYPMVNLKGNADGKITIYNGRLNQQKFDSSTCAPLESDRVFLSKFGEELSPYSMPFRLSGTYIFVPADSNIKSYYYMVHMTPSDPPGWLPENMIVYLPERELLATGTIPKAEKPETLPIVTDSFGIEFNTEIMGSVSETNGKYPVMKIHSYPENDLIAEMELTPENLNDGYFRLGNGEDAAQDNIFFINTDKLGLKEGNSYILSLDAYSLKDSIGFIKQKLPVSQPFTINKIIPPDPIDPPESSKPEPPESSTPEPPSSSKPPVVSSSSPSSSSDTPQDESSSPAPKPSSSSSSSKPASKPPSSRPASSKPAASSSQKDNSNPAPAPVVRPAASSSSATSRSVSSTSSSSAVIAASSGNTSGTVNSDKAPVPSANAPSTAPSEEILQQETESITSDADISSNITFSIGNSEVPLFGNLGEVWSLANLILILLSLAFSVIMGILNSGLNRGRNVTRRGKMFALISAGVTLFSGILFLLLQNLSAPMALFDIYTILFTLLFASQIVVMLIARSNRRYTEQ